MKRFFILRVQEEDVKILEKVKSPDRVPEGSPDRPSPTGTGGGEGSPQGKSPPEGVPRQGPPEGPFPGYGSGGTGAWMPHDEEVPDLRSNEVSRRREGLGEKFPLCGTFADLPI